MSGTSYGIGNVSAPPLLVAANLVAGIGGCPLVEVAFSSPGREGSATYNLTPNQAQALARRMLRCVEFERREHDNQRRRERAKR